jgi:hypothetical protein
MAEPALHREVDLPRPRSSGAAVVAVASLAMFTAVGASAFIVRVRSAPPRPSCKMRPRAAYEQLSAQSASEQRFRDAAMRGDRFRALVIYRDELAQTPVVESIQSLRDELERTHLEAELVRVAADVDGHQCETAHRRLQVLHDLLPEVRINVELGDCL